MTSIIEKSDQHADSIFNGERSRSSQRSAMLFQRFFYFDFDSKKKKWPRGLSAHFFHHHQSQPQNRQQRRTLLRFSTNQRNKKRLVAMKSQKLFKGKKTNLFQSFIWTIEDWASLRTFAIGGSNRRSAWRFAFIETNFKSLDLLFDGKNEEKLSAFFSRNGNSKWRPARWIF